MLSQAHEQWFEMRGIGGEILARMGVYSGTPVGSGDERKIVPTPNGKIICFPYFEQDICVAEKYRTIDKKFWAKPGGKRTFYNADILDDPDLRKDKALIICEGEIDCLSWIEIGYPFVVSVPDGAPPDRPIRPLDQVQREGDAKFEFILNNWERLAPIKKIILATDNDGPGNRLREELARRLGKARCYWISYPSDCKDSNDVLVKHGAAGLMNLWTAAKEIPVAGVYRIDDYPEQEFTTFRTGWSEVDKHFRPFVPSLTVLTGTTSRGKSTFVNQLLAQMAKIHGWHIAVGSFEMRVRPHLFQSLATVLFDGLSIEEWCNEPVHMARAKQFVRDYFAFITPELDNDEKNTDIEWLIKRAETCVIRYGTRALLIDPWNELEHCRQRGEGMSDYTGRVLRRLKEFARQFDCAVFICAHPGKDGATKEAKELSLYDVADSAHFANKADFGIIVQRCGPQDEWTEIHIRKVRFQPETGMPTPWEQPLRLCFDRAAGLFGQ